MIIADMLSQAYLPANRKDSKLDKEVELQVHMLVTNLPISDEQTIGFKKAIKEDETRQKPKEIVKIGWPNSKDQVPKEIRHYWDFRDEIHEAQDLLFKGNNLIVPKSKQKEMLQIIHGSHLGVIKCKSRARDLLYWPGMSMQIKHMCSNCAVCLEHRKTNFKEPLIPHEAPKRAWSKVDTDLFYLNGHNYIIVVDYFSQYPEIQKLTNTPSTEVITALKSIFVRYGIPDTVVSDNGPQYSSHKFRAFAQNWQFNHVTSSPGYPQMGWLRETYKLSNRC